MKHLPSGWKRVKRQEDSPWLIQATYQMQLSLREDQITQELLDRLVVINLEKMQELIERDIREVLAT